VTEAVTLAVVTGSLSLAGTALSGYIAARVARLQVQANANAVHLADQHDAIKELAHNTNGIKEELVKVTGQKAFAEGLKVGADAARDAQVIGATLKPTEVS